MMIFYQTHLLFMVIRLGVLLTICITSFNLYAAPWVDWSSNNIQLLHGNHFKLGDTSRSIMTFQHANGWRYGSNFFFIDIDNRSEAGGAALYSEFYPRLSWSKISGKTPDLGLFKDYSVVAGLNVGNLPKQDSFKAYLLGGGLHFDIPHFNYFTLDIMAFKSENVATTGIQVSPVWSIPFQLGKLHFEFKGYLDWQSADATGGVSTILTQPQLLLDVGHLFDHKGAVYAGIEYHYWHNKFGIKGVTEKVPQAMLMLTF